MQTLIISHLLYLNKDQRYRLHSGEPIETVGVSVPVLFEKGSTSEPAKELFCKYTLTNEPPNKGIVPTEQGYILNLPQKIVAETKTNEEKLKLDALNKVPTSENILDVRDGGHQYLHFKQYNKIHFSNIEMNIVHIIDIRDEDFLIDSLDQTS